MNLNEIALLLSQTGQYSTECIGVCTDSRLSMPGQLFIAISGEHFDGHDFVIQAQKQGAVAVVVQRPIDGISIPQFIVPDTLLALAQIAKAHRLTVKCPVIAVTGSNGKTTVKEMIAAILPQPSHATKGNLNNH
ncbi:MAG: Mur ligase domain-containing protein, partial [Legionellales bacterium]